MTTLRSKAYNKPLLRRIKSRLGIIEPLLGKFDHRLEIKPHLVRIDPCFGIIKPVKGLNTKPNLGNVFRIARKSAATELKTPLIDDTSAKAEKSLFIKLKRERGNIKENILAQSHVNFFVIAHCDYQRT